MYVVIYILYLYAVILYILCVMQGGWTALTWASYKGRVEVASILLENGGNPNTTGQVKSPFQILKVLKKY